MKRTPTENRTLNKKRKFSFLLTVAFLAMVCYTVFHFVELRTQINEQKLIEASLTEQCAEQEAQNNELERILDENDVDEYIEKKARDNAYVMPGERVFHDASAD